ncbi:DUF6415 family natural product biosynthesis protein [Streptomyces sp. URMC 124]|uniref:DUF6415 family natural product biosynthesis protein n=1 Tax=Streptomyces sp. URMC 124 TaxID=3423405 RepID=UPI003F1AE92E
MISTPQDTLSNFDRTLIESDIEQGLQIVETHDPDDSLLDLATRLRMHINRLSLLVQAEVLRMKRGTGGGRWARAQAHAQTARRLLETNIEIAASAEEAEQYVHELARNATALLTSLGGSDART